MAAKKTRVRASKSGVKKTLKKYTCFRKYIAKVLRSIHPDQSATCKSISIMNSFVLDTFERIANEAKVLAMKAKRRTIYSKDVRAAVLLTVPRNLAKKAILHASNAVSLYSR